MSFRYAPVLSSLDRGCTESCALRGRGPWVIRRLPLLLLVSGALLKAALIAAVRITGSATAYQLAAVYDPLSFWLAQQGVNLAFDQRRFAPTPEEAIAFDVLLVLSFALQCFLLGLILRGIFTSRPPTR